MISLVATSDPGDEPSGQHHLTRRNHNKTAIENVLIRVKNRQKVGLIVTGA